jgi:hypothetical protein
MAMAATDKLSALGMSLLGHMLLLGSIVSDFFRRTGDGIWLIVLSMICLVSLLIGGVFFTRNPRSFFFMSDNIASSRKNPSVTSRLLVWTFVVMVPVVWILAGIDLLPNAIPSELLRRIVGSYLFFAYVAGAIIVSPFLFNRRG